MRDQWVTITEVAAQLSVNERTVRRFIHSGLLPASYFGSVIRIRESDVHEMGRPVAATTVR